MANTKATLDKIVAWSKRRGFVFPASDVYGGLANTYDYGPYGTQLKENLKNLWWKRFVQAREDIFGIDSTIILRPEIWEASGHTTGFADVMVEDKVNHKRYRADHIVEERLEKLSDTDLAKLLEKFADASEEQKQGLGHRKVDGFDPEVISKVMVAIGEVTGKPVRSQEGNEFTEPKRFNQLFQTEVGIVAGEKNKVYLRGEIAQGLFMNFKNILDSMHPKLPFGIGQAGKAFRNEITPGKFTFRTLEFDLMEFEYFFDPTTTDWNELFEMWKAEMKKFAAEIGLKAEHLRWREHEEFERSFYSSRTEDLEYEFPWGFKEMWGLAYRTDYDLRNHTEKSGKDLSYVYPDGNRVIPHVVEPTFGLSRLVTVMIFDAYDEEEVNGNVRTVLRFNPKIAPVQIAVFPLQKDEQLVAKAREVFDSLNEDYRVEFDNAGNIGKMYRRQDEIGTPYCVTIDFDTLEQGSVTIRDRDTMQQERIAIADLQDYFSSKFKGN